MNQDLEDLVRRMRAAQRDYFRTRSRDSLRLSQELETRVDRELEAKKTGDLFPGLRPAPGGDPDG